VSLGRVVSRRLREQARWLLAAGLAAVMASSAASLDPMDLAGERIRRLVDACSRQMTDSVCRVANDAVATIPEAPVFVAGSGQVDTASYRTLRAAGDAMCVEVQRSCTADWTGPVCNTARRLWGGR
jgi:hypothetical protein